MGNVQSCDSYVKGGANGQASAVSSQRYGTGVRLFDVGSARASGGTIQALSRNVLRKTEEKHEAPGSGRQVSSGSSRIEHLLYRNLHLSAARASSE
jgi:hypothetical protein